LIIGLAYKKNVDDTRERRSFKPAELLETRGAVVDVHNPLVAVVPRTREHAGFAGRRSAPLNAAAVAPFSLQPAPVRATLGCLASSSPTRLAPHRAKNLTVKGLKRSQGLRQPGRTTDRVVASRLGSPNRTALR
jgi:hypothetical protein